MFTVKFNFSKIFISFGVFKNISCLRLRIMLLNKKEAVNKFKNISCLRLRNATQGVLIALL